MSKLIVYVDMDGVLADFDIMLPPGSKKIRPSCLNPASSAACLSSLAL